MSNPHYRRPPSPPDIEARISYLSSENGGRRYPAFSGYRAPHNFGIPGELNDAQHEYLDGDPVLPGQTARALLWLVAPERQAGRLHIGFRFSFQDGAKTVGHGEVTAVLNEALVHNRTARPPSE